MIINYHTFDISIMPRVSFTTSQLSAILDALEEELPGEMPNAIMDILTRRLIVNGNVSKSVDVNPDTSEFVHDYDSSDSETDYSYTSSDSESFTESGSSSSESSDWHSQRKKKAKKAKNTPPTSSRSKTPMSKKSHK